MLITLTLTFIFLVLITGGDRTAKSLISLGFNAFILLCVIFAINLGGNPLICSIIACVIISLITLFYQNEFNIKTKTAFFSVLIVIFLLFIMIFKLVHISGIQGFPINQLAIQDSNGYSRNIGINMFLVQISVILLIFIGAILDTSLAVTSSLYEIALNNKILSTQELFISGISVGCNILSSTINTLFFIYIAEYLTLFIQFVNEYSFIQIINSKEFCQEFISISISGIGCILIIPIASLLGAISYKKHHHTSIQ